MINQNTKTNKKKNEKEKVKETQVSDPIKELEEPFIDEQELAKMGFTEEQVSEANQMDKDEQIYTREIKQIQSSIMQLAEMFKDLHSQVMMQGSTLDNIYLVTQNIEYTVKAAVEETKEAEKQQKKTGQKMLMLLLLIALFGFIIFIIIRILLG